MAALNWDGLNASSPPAPTVTVWVVTAASTVVEGVDTVEDESVVPEAAAAEGAAAAGAGAPYP